jgi:hypothetical protein
MSYEHLFSTLTFALGYFATGSFVRHQLIRLAHSGIDFIGSVIGRRLGSRFQDGFDVRCARVEDTARWLIQNGDWDIDGTDLYAEDVKPRDTVLYPHDALVAQRVIWS